MMRAFFTRRCRGAALIPAVLLLWATPRVEGRGIRLRAWFGDPFVFIAPQMVPSPTDYLHDVSLARVAASNAARSATAAESLRGSPNAYWNRIRDHSGANTYDIASRQSLSRRVGSRPRATPAPARAAAPAPAPAATVPARPERHALDDFFLANGEVDWPRDAANDGAFRSDRAAFDDALRTVRDQVRAGHATAQSVADARAKLIAYGQQSLDRVRSDRSTAIANVFHYFLLFLNDTLEDLGSEAP